MERIVDTIMIIVILVGWNANITVSQSVTQTTQATCQQVKQELEKKVPRIHLGDQDNVPVTRTVDCVSAK